MKEKTEEMQEQFTRWAMKILAISQAALSYSDSPYEIERAKELREIALEMLGWQMDQPVDSVQKMMCIEEGYLTPKVDTRAAAFMDNRILLVKEKNGKWSLPGGWCEVDLSVGENAIKEMKEESGYEGKAIQLIAVQEWRRNNPCDLPYGVVKIFIECSIEKDGLPDGIETTQAKFFGKDELPENLCAEKNTREQILLCFQAHEKGAAWKTQFD